MYKSIVLSLFCMAIGGSVLAKEIKYPVVDIEPALKENAHTVIRLYQQELEVQSEKSAVVRITEVRTILNKNGDSNAEFEETYDPMNKITSVKGKIYNEVGEVIRRIGFDDIIDRTSIDGYSLFDDNRVKYIKPGIVVYPYTVEYVYEVQLRQTLFLPSWSHGLLNTSYENSSYTIKVPAGYGIRFKEYNLPGGVVKSTQDGKDVYAWSLTGLPARTSEPMSSYRSPNFPLVRVVSNNFAVGDSRGSAESWRDLGIWASELIAGRDQLPEATIAKMKELTASCKTEYDKVKVIYEYMQKKTRYVSIQVGIGGWQPFPAETVDRLSYGDCKALTNYTKALLSAVGITSYYTLVKAGSSGSVIDDSFPSSQFNHVILCVPVAKDTMWLECTSQRSPCGFNGDFTDDRMALVVDKENSRLVHTRVYPASQNQITRMCRVSLKDEESGSAGVKASYCGLSYDDVSSIYYADAVDKPRLISQNIHLPSFTLAGFSYKEHRGPTPVFDESLSLDIRNYMRKTGDNLLLPVNFLNRLTSLPDKVRGRKSSMSIRRASVETDTVVYTLPKGFVIDALPAKSEIATAFGRYESNTVASGATITYVRRLELYKGDFPAADYKLFRAFLEQVSVSDDAVVSLRSSAANSAANP